MTLKEQEELVSWCKSWALSVDIGSRFDKLSDEEKRRILHIVQKDEE